MRVSGWDSARGALRTGCLVGAMVLVQGAAGASEQSDLLIDEGIGVLQTGDLLGATNLFIDAYDADPQDGQAAIYVGGGMNRIGDFVQALAALTAATNLGYESPEIDVQMVIPRVMDILLIGTRIVRDLVGFNFDYTGR